eukprot:Sspe_Gene.56643::Locus_31142_Transcript_2_5_Confidence_0.286_Length_692::g.56643::m.56643
MDGRRPPQGGGGTIPTVSPCPMPTHPAGEPTNWWLCSGESCPDTSDVSGSREGSPYRDVDLRQHSPATWGAPLLPSPLLRVEETMERQGLLVDEMAERLHLSHRMIAWLAHMRSEGHPRGWGDPM